MFISVLKRLQFPGVTAANEQIQYYIRWAKLTYSCLRPKTQFESHLTKVYHTYTPVRAPGNGGDQANVRKKDGVVFDAIQGVVHLAERQSVQLELQLHLTVRPQSGCCFINGKVVKLLSCRLWLHNTQNTIQNTTDHMLF